VSVVFVSGRSDLLAMADKVILLRQGRSGDHLTRSCWRTLPDARPPAYRGGGAGCLPGADNASNDTLELPELLMPLGAQDVHSGRILHGTLIALSAAVLGAIGWAAMAQVSDVPAPPARWSPMPMNAASSISMAARSRACWCARATRWSPDSR
jgi:hypothetical protein